MYVSPLSTSIIIPLLTALFKWLCWSQHPKSYGGDIGFTQLFVLQKMSFLWSKTFSLLNPFMSWADSCAVDLMYLNRVGVPAYMVVRFSTINRAASLAVMVLMPRIRWWTKRLPTCHKNPPNNVSCLSLFPSLIANRNILVLEPLRRMRVEGARG
jgi:hypothetical protein